MMKSDFDMRKGVGDDAESGECNNDNHKGKENNEAKNDPAAGEKKPRDC